MNIVRDRTTRAIERQLNAMGCESYEVGIRKARAVTDNPNEKEKVGMMMNQEMTREQLLKSAPRLKNLNMRGNDIYIRPTQNDQSGRGLILVDDVDGATIAEMRANGHNPCLTVETSPKNFQAWVKIDPSEISSGRHKQEIARGLAQTYDGDMGSADARHYGRLSGFTNQKEMHEDKYGQQPYCLCHHANGREFAWKGPELAKQAKQRLESKQQISKKEVKPVRQWDQIDQNLTFENQEHATAWYKKSMKAELSKGKNSSEIDFKLSCRMASMGYKPDYIAKTIKSGSINIKKRKTGNVRGESRVDYYSRHTAENAEKAVKQKGEFLKRVNKIKQEKHQKQKNRNTFNRMR